MCIFLPSFSFLEKLNGLLFTFKKELSESGGEDEHVNRLASFLSAFKTIATVSCWCEAKVVSLLFQHTKEQHLDQETVAKVCTTSQCINTSYSIF